MINPGEVAADIGFEHVAYLLRHDLQTQGLQGVMRVAPRSKTKTAIEEIGFKHSLEYARNRSLQQPVRHSGNPQRSRAALARTLGYFDPSDRWRSVRACPQLFADFLNPLLHLAGKLFGALPVDAACCLPIHHSPSFLEECRRQQVRQRGEPHLSIQFGLLRYLTELR